MRVFALAVLLALSEGSGADRVGDALMATGQRLAPAGTTVTFFGRAQDLAISRDGLVAVKNSHGIVFVDASSARIVQDLRLPKRPEYAGDLGGNGMTGILWSPDGSTVWSADGFGRLYSARRTAEGTFAWDPAIVLPGETPAPTGLALSADGSTVYVALSSSNAVAAVDVATRAVRYTIPTGTAPFGLLRSGNVLYVSNLGGTPPSDGGPGARSGMQGVRVDPHTGIASSGTVTAIDLTKRTPVAQIRTGLLPGALALSRDGKRLFVADANGDSIVVVDTARDTVERSVALPMQQNFGASPSAIAVSPSDGDVYVAEGGDNRLLVLDPTTLSPRGQVRTGWYPDAVGFGTDGTLFVTNMKGIGSRSVRAGRRGYNAYDFTGSLQIVHGASASFDRPARSSQSFLGYAPEPAAVRLHALFKHVIYIIKENRTYDDIFGDVAAGNGDSKLCPFPQRVTPNHHALAARFGLFDNFYVDGVLSADGHQWTDEAFANDYVERNMASWARTYPSDGTDPLAYAASGFIWEHALDAGLTF